MVKRETKDRPLQISDLWEEHEFRSLKLCEANLDPECPSPGYDLVLCLLGFKSSMKCS
eukprot:CAMPEP_0175172344 /NCGR_PEP_ID=MMETSP0087-20121206/31374_1 /TAXON_ID=136419 /ORGANISM="Unknown Unknown, Strain D1" /LENGTH=57 /DNA_ID=CAMNT_0016463391 /DNA_START=1 /DNA_END=170 /DNA_ORIENTATION=+